MASNKAAWIRSAQGKLEVAEAPYNKPLPDEIVVHSRAVAINPVDWKMQDLSLFIEKFPSIFGCDVAGVVKEVGSAVSGFEPGDRVISNAVVLTKGIEYAAFQTYVKCPANVTAKLPEKISMEQGCVLPLAVNTAAIGLFSKTNLALPLPTMNAQSVDKVIFIYGGSTSVGSTAIQLAKAAGVRVFTTASQRNHEHCTALGADRVIDYKDPDWIDTLVEELAGKNLIGAYDSVSHGDTTKSCATLLSKVRSGRIVITTNPPPDDTTSITVFGANMTLDSELARSIWHGFLQPALAAGTFFAQPSPRVVGTGLEDLQQAMDIQRQGVSALKLVVKLS